MRAVRASEPGKPPPDREDHSLSRLVRDWEIEHGVDVEAVIPEGVCEKAVEFAEAGGERYQKA